MTVGTEPIAPGIGLAPSLRPPRGSCFSPQRRRGRGGNPQKIRKNPIARGAIEGPNEPPERAIASPPLTPAPRRFRPESRLGVNRLDGFNAKTPRREGDPGLAPWGLGGLALNPVRRLEVEGGEGRGHEHPWLSPFGVGGIRGRGADAPGVSDAGSSEALSRRGAGGQMRWRLEAHSWKR